MLGMSYESSRREDDRKNGKIIDLLKTALTVTVTVACTFLGMGISDLRNKPSKPEMEAIVQKEIAAQLVPVKKDLEENKSNLAMTRVDLSSLKEKADKLDAAVKRGDGDIIIRHYRNLPPVVPVPSNRR
jgi:hypothetical protein